MRSFVEKRSALNLIVKDGCPYKSTVAASTMASGQWQR